MTKAIELTDEEIKELKTAVDGILMTMGMFSTTSPTRMFGNNDKQKKEVNSKIKIFEDIKKKLK